MTNKNNSDLEVLDKAMDALKENERYHAIENRLKEMYGVERPLDYYVDRLEQSLRESGSKDPLFARILTYEDAKAWEEYKSIGTPQECRKAMSGHEKPSFDKDVELFDTVDMMNSDDYKDRFMAEYYQLKIRYRKLCAMISAWDDDALSFVPSCPRSVYDMQLRAMRDYLSILEARAAIEF